MSYNEEPILIEVTPFLVRFSITSVDQNIERTVSWKVLEEIVLAVQMLADLKNAKLPGCSQDVVNFYINLLRDALCEANRLHIKIEGIN